MIDLTGPRDLAGTSLNYTRSLINNSSAEHLAASGPTTQAVMLAVSDVLLSQKVDYLGTERYFSWKRINCIEFVAKSLIYLFCPFLALLLPY